MKLDIMSPTSSETLNINWIEVNTPQGSFVVEKGHAPTIATLSQDKYITVNLEQNNQEKKIKISGGVIHVQRDKVTILVI